MPTARNLRVAIYMAAQTDGVAAAIRPSAGLLCDRPLPMGANTERTNDREAESLRTLVGQMLGGTRSLGEERGPLEGPAPQASSEWPKSSARRAP